MSHRIEQDDTMAYREMSGRPWHGLGTPVPEQVSDQDFFLASGLDWKTVSMPMLIQGKREQRPADGYQALVRSTDGKLRWITLTDCSSGVKRGNAPRLRGMASPH